MPYTNYPFELPPLPYEYDALEPSIDTETMRYHHDKHFKTYIDNLNTAIAPYPRLHSLSVEQLLARPAALPREARTAIMRNGGGVYNHERFFNGLAPAAAGGHRPTGNLASLIDRDFGGLESFYTELSRSALAVFGSGWTYLIQNRAGRLECTNLANQDTLIAQGITPILLVDVWEHAYYLKYKSARADYLRNLRNILVFPNLILR